MRPKGTCVSPLYLMSLENTSHYLYSSNPYAYPIKQEDQDYYPPRPVHNHPGYHSHSNDFGSNHFMYGAQYTTPTAAVVPPSLSSSQFNNNNTGHHSQLKSYPAQQHEFYPTRPTPSDIFAAPNSHHAHAQSQSHPPYHASRSNLYHHHSLPPSSSPTSSSSSSSSSASSSPSSSVSSSSTQFPTGGSVVDVIGYNTPTTCATPKNQSSINLGRMPSTGLQGPHHPIPLSSTTTSSISKIHIPNNTNPNPNHCIVVLGERYPCANCDKTFSRSHDRKRHVETQHNPNRMIHSCKECGREFGRSDSLKRHVEHAACQKR